MGDTWISNMRHFLDEDGMITIDLPQPAFRLANYFGTIVKAVSCHQDREKLHTGIKCRRRPGRKPCPGEILALIDKQNDFVINWHCTKCDDNGLISGWQGTIYDYSASS
jgi:hypothetical protein